MDKLSQMDDVPYIFGSVLGLANRIDTLLERELKEFDVTAKQWFYSIVIANLFDNPPTIKEVANAAGSSHQNVKQVALKMERKGLIKLEKDPKDARATRLLMTEDSYRFWAKTEAKGKAFMGALFNGIEKEELCKTRSAISKMLFNLSLMENKD